MRVLDGETPRRTPDGGRRRRRGRQRRDPVPPIIAAVEADATVGEIAERTRGVFGEHDVDG